MKASLSARSISRSVYERLERKIRHARVLAVFDHACDLVTPDGDVIALVAPRIGNGPLNIVIDAEPADFASFEPGLAATLHETDLQIGETRVALNSARIWEPCPDWSTLRKHQNIIAHRLPVLRARAWHHAPRPPSNDPAGMHMASIIQQATQALQAGWNGETAQLRIGAAQLAGLGHGLTPAGDDVLAGMMLRAWLAHHAPGEFCRVVVETAAPRTTTLSGAFLRSAAKGECSAAWHRLLAALVSGSEDELDAAARQVLSYGATSGADTLAGFLQK